VSVLVALRVEEPVRPPRQSDLVQQGSSLELFVDSERQVLKAAPWIHVLVSPRPTAPY
jgi:hypothetical protein